MAVRFLTRPSGAHSSRRTNGLLARSTSTCGRAAEIALSRQDVDVRPAPQASDPIPNRRAAAVCDQRRSHPFTDRVQRRNRAVTGKCSLVLLVILRDLVV